MTIVQTDPESVSKTEPVSVVLKVMKLEPCVKRGIEADHVLRMVFKDMAYVDGVTDRFMRDGKIHATMTREAARLMRRDIRIENVSTRPVMQ